MKQTTLNL